MSNLVDRFQEYSTWRFALGQEIRRYGEWLKDNQFSDVTIESRLARIQERLADDKLTIAFVAEFSRGKSELINAIFFADYGKRILPSSAGRTTMCPTELLFDSSMPSTIRLLPIETRARHATTAEYKQYPEEWQVFPLDTTSGDGMLEALRRVSETKYVSVDEAKAYTLFDEQDPDQIAQVNADGQIEISKWRHAIINFPHPLLEQGLVILDTPGLNAIGTEPELTLSLIPSAHAVLFVLAADTGVTKSDIEVWRQHLSANRQDGRMVVLNKIDSMWDELKTPEQIEAEINRQVSSCGAVLGLDTEYIFPVSAQKGLVGKVNHDKKLLERSRLPVLEAALSNDLIPAKQEIVRSQVEQELRALVQGTQNILDARSRNIIEQLHELKGLRGKNQNVVEHMVTRVQNEKSEFDKSLLRLQAIRAVFARLTNELFTSLGMESLRTEVRRTRENMVKSRFSFGDKGLRGIMDTFFINIRSHLEKSGHISVEIMEMMTAMYKKFSEEHGLILAKPIPFSNLKYLKEIDRIEKVYQQQFSGFTILTREKLPLTQKFFESIATRIKETFDVANRDVESWLKAIMAPVEAQVREHQLQLRRRLDSIKRIQEASDTLEGRIDELEEFQSSIEQQMMRVGELAQRIDDVLKAELDADFALAAA